MGQRYFEQHVSAVELLLAFSDLMVFDLLVDVACCQTKDLCEQDWLEFRKFEYLQGVRESLERHSLGHL